MTPATLAPATLAPMTLVPMMAPLPLVTLALTMARCYCMLHLSRLPGDKCTLLQCA